MKKNILFSIFFICTSVLSYSSDTLNYTDKVGKRQGKWILTNNLLPKPKPNYKPDQKVEEGKYLDSRKIGKWYEYYPNDRVKTIINYVNNKPLGHAVLYHDNGKVKEEGLWNNNRWVGEYKLYYENGEVQQAFNFNTSGKRVDKQTYYYDNGNVMIEGNWEDGKEAGLLTEYYENGDIKSEKNFNGGNIDAATIKNYEPKKPVAKTTTGTKPEVKGGPAVNANPEVEKSLSEKFAGYGPHKLYNASKQLTKDGVFQNYKLIEGKVYHYNKDGLLTRIAIYKDGKYVGDGVVEEQ